MLKPRIDDENRKAEMARWKEETDPKSKSPNTFTAGGAPRTVAVGKKK